MKCITHSVPWWVESHFQRRVVLSVHHFRHHDPKPHCLFSPCLAHLFGSGWVNWIHRALQVFLRSKPFILAASLMCVIFWVLAFREVPGFTAIISSTCHLFPKILLHNHIFTERKELIWFCWECQMAIFSRNTAVRFRSIRKDYALVRVGRLWRLDQKSFLQKTGSLLKRSQYSQMSAISISILLLPDGLCLHYLNKHYRNKLYELVLLDLSYRWSHWN